MLFFRHPFTLLILVTAATLLAYLPGLPGPFVFDDIQNIVENRAIAITSLDADALAAAAHSGPQDGIGRPLAMLSYALNYYVAGEVAAVSFKVTNLAIHLINTALIYWLTSLLLRAAAIGDTRLVRWLPPLSALLWALHPIQLTVVLYTVQRMTSLSALFVLAGLLLFVHGRIDLRASAWRGCIGIAAGIACGAIGGFAAKENAVLMPLYALLIEYTFFERSALTTSQRRALLATYGAVAALPLLFGAIWMLAHPEVIVAGYAGRDFTPLQRLLTEARVLWFYLGLLLFPMPGRFTLFHDDIALSTGLITPWTTLPALLGLAAALIVALVYRRRTPVLSFAILWFLAGHCLESGILPLELAHEHRNYLPAFGPLFALAYILCRFGRARAVVYASVGCALILGSITTARAITWATEERLIETMVREHPGSARSHAMYAELLATRGSDIPDAIGHYQRAMVLAPHEPAFPLRLSLLLAANVAHVEGGPANAPVAWQLLGESFPRDIAAQLASGPITALAMRTLAQISDCITTKQGSCAQLLPDFIAWHEALQQNPRVTREMKLALLRQVFDVAHAHGRYQAALAAAEQGYRLDARAADFLLMQADALVALKRFDDAERTLVSLETDGPAAEERRESIQAIRNSMRRARPNRRSNKQL